MNVKRTILILLALLTILAMTSCEMITDFIESRTRPIPVIEIFNGNLEKTRKMLPNDTLYVRVQGLAPGAEHTVQVLDPSLKVVSELVTYSDGDGKIDMTPLWYDIGFKIKPADDPNEPGRIYLNKADLSVSAFYIKVADELDTPKTNFKIQFFFISTNENLDRQQPIVMSGKSVAVTVDGVEVDQFIPWNAFYSDQQDLVTLDYFNNDGDEITPTVYERFTNTLYVKIDQLEPLTAGSNDEVRIWILPTRSDPFLDGESIGSSAYFYQTFNVSDFDEPVEIQWPGGVEAPTYPVDVGNLADTEKQYLIPEWAEEHTFTIFADMKNLGVFGSYEIMKDGFTSYYLDGIDGNGVAGFIVKSHVEPVNITEMQLASNGKYQGDSHWNITDNGYVDEFKQDGSDTFGWLGSYWAPKGVRVSWNPYIYKAYGLLSYRNEGEGTALSEYVGHSVNVHVVRATHDLDDGTTIDVNSVKRTIPIQLSCRNGAGMQTIWRAPYVSFDSTEVLGDYMIIVDMDRDGKISDGDLVDNKRVSTSDTRPGGFSIVEN